MEICGQKVGRGHDGPNENIMAARNDTE